MTTDPAVAAVEHLISLQQPDGRWEGEVVWNTTLLSQYVLTSAMVGRWPFPDQDRDRVLRQFEATRLPDGSWPLHGEAPGSLFATTLAYVALRVLGVPPDTPLTAEARRWLHVQPGGVAVVPTWGRMWLAMLGLYEYEGINPIAPEAVLLPGWFPAHPDRLYVHTRMIFFGLSCLYAERFLADIGPLRDVLRGELFDAPYQSVDFGALRAERSAEVVVPPGRLLRLLAGAQARYERHALRAPRAAAVRQCRLRICDELAASAGHGVSPVSALVGCLALASAGQREDAISALARLDAWRWEDQDAGLRIAGAKSAAWDTAFAMRALLAAEPVPAVRDALGRGYRWLAGAQALEELPAAVRKGRDQVLGGWSFSDGTHRWPVSDCTAEALSVVLEVHRRADLAAVLGPRVEDERLFAAVRFILSRRNADGGFGTYERARAPRVLERLNTTELYADCMTDFSHPEPTASCVSALTRFSRDYPGFRATEVQAAIRGGIRHLRSRQRADGSYPGSWGINFTYGTCFVLEALLTAGVPPGDPAVASAVRWLRGTQKPDGGWGEHYSGCLTRTYAEHRESQAAMTAWAMLSLTRAARPGDPAARRAAECLTAMRSLEGGGWPRQAASGVFFRTAVLDYRLYKEVFPTWALALFADDQDSWRS